MASPKIMSTVTNCVLCWLMMVFRTDPLLHIWGFALHGFFPLKEELRKCCPFIQCWWSSPNPLKRFPCLLWSGDAWMRGCPLAQRTVASISSLSGDSACFIKIVGRLGYKRGTNASHCVVLNRLLDIDLFHSHPVGHVKGGEKKRKEKGRRSG